MPRSTKAPVNAIADQLQQANIFGGAKPRDEKEYEEKRKEKETSAPEHNEDLGSGDEEQR